MTLNKRGEGKEHERIREENAYSRLRRTAMNRNGKTAESAWAQIMATEISGDDT